MKLFFLISIAFLFNHSTSGQCGLSDLEKLKIKGDVSVLKETGISVKNGENKTDYIKVTNFNINGRAQGATFASSVHNLTPKKTTFEFDDLGNKILEKRYGLNNDIEETLVFKYDSLGNMIEAIIYVGTKFLDSYEYYKYDSRCFRTSYSAFMKDSSLWFSYTFDHDENGYITALIDSNEQTITTYVNDKTGWVVSSETVDFSGQKLSSSTCKFQYDKKGNVLRHTEFDANQKELKAYAYTYDKKGNWIQKVSYREGVVTWIDNREYTYR